MKNWKLKVKNSPQEISESLKSIDGLVFNSHPDTQNSIKFEMRKRILYAWYLIYDNSIVVNGKLSKTDNENTTDIDILFNQHALWKLVIFLHFFLGMGFLIALIVRKGDNVFTYLLGLIILALGIVLWVKVQKKYKRNIQEYKTLISKTLGV